MTRAAIKSKPALAALAALALLPGTPAWAAPKVWVANTGNDFNPCTVASPCATFAHAHGVVDAGGEIGILTPGDYAAVTIAKSVSITNDGVGEAGILVSALTIAIDVNAGHGAVVGLRGLVLD